jgi:aminopeptidase-like protein
MRTHAMSDSRQRAGGNTLSGASELRGLIERLDDRSVADEMRQLVTELFPFCRSITGEGLRRSLRAVDRRIPLALSEVPSGTHVFDWVVPREWNVRGAWVKGPSGDVVVDFARSNLHLLNYSVPFRGRVSLEELKSHLYSLPEQPSLVPYRTSYYAEKWGFCLAHDDLARLPPGDYEVLVDTSLEDGSLTYGEHVVPGATEDEVLVSAHCCHPSLCNDNLSGVALSAALARLLGTTRPRYTYRFLFAPGTIGAIAWLARNEERAHRVKHGVVVACVGDRGALTYKRSRRGDAEIDRAVAHVLAHSGERYSIRDFVPAGYDERQYCSPGFDLAVGSLTRTPHNEYPEYHTSADDLGFVDFDALVRSLRRYLEVVEVLEGNGTYVNLSPKCEPQLGKRGLFGQGLGGKGYETYQLALLWVLNQSDGRHALLDVADRAKLPFPVIRSAADALERTGLLRREPAASPEAG